MSVTYQPDHDQLAQDVLLSYYKKRGVRIQALVSALALGVQAFEDEAFDTLMGTPLSVATGGALDQWALLLGEARGVMGDGELRTLLNIKIETLTSTGSIADILHIWLLLVDGSDSARYAPAYPAAYRLHVTTSTAFSAEVVARIVRVIELVRPAAIGAEYIETPSGGFRFDDASRGFDQAPMGRRLI